MSGPGRPRALRVLVTCEHGGHRIPGAFAAWFEGAGDALASHRGWDPGALALAEDLGRSLGAPVRSATVSRLLVDLNRSPRHPRVFSEWVPSEATLRADLLARFHAPYRGAVDADVRERCAAGATVVHLGIHSFTPTLNGKTRRPDLALLYDPARRLEAHLCAEWTRGLRERLPHLVVRRNEPYRGVSDGLTTWLRARHAPERYLGIEVEVNQRLLDREGRFPAEVSRELAAQVVEAAEELGWPRLEPAPY